MTKDELRSEILDYIIYFVKRKEGIFFDYKIGDDTVVVCPCSYYSPEQLIEHLYTGDLVECFCHYLVFTDGNENNFDASTLDELVDKLYDYSKTLAKLQKERKALQKYYEKHRYDFGFNQEAFNKYYFMLFGYEPGKKFGKSKHESVDFKVEIEFEDITADMLTKIKTSVAQNDFSMFYENCPEITQCQLYQDPDLPIVSISGILLDEMLAEELKALEEKSNLVYNRYNINDIRVVV